MLVDQDSTTKGADTMNQPCTSTGMVVARIPQNSERIARISKTLADHGITHECRPYIVNQPRSRAHGADYTMIIVDCGPGSRALDAYDIATRTR